MTRPRYELEEQERWDRSAGAAWELAKENALAHAQALTKSFENPTERVEATTTPEGAKGWVDQGGSAQFLAGGHGLDVAPDASPEGVRAETRREEDGAGGEPSNAPVAALKSPGRPPDAGTLVDLSATSPVAASPSAIGEASGCPCNVVAIDSRRT